MNLPVSLYFNAIVLLTLMTGCEGENTEQSCADQFFLPVDTLQVVFEIGEEIGDSTNTFWSIAAAAIDSQGRIFVLDDIGTCVKVFDFQGNYLQQVSRRGDGPGELARPKGLTVLPDGRLVIAESNKCGYVVFDDSLEFVEEIGLWANNSPYGISAMSNSKMVVCRYDEDPTNDFIRHTVTICNWGEEGWETLLWKDSMEASPDLYSNASEEIIFVVFNKLNTSSDGNGNTYFTPPDPFEYRVISWDSSGVEILNFTRDVLPVEKTPEEIAGEINNMNAYYRFLSGGRPPHFEFHPAIYKNLTGDVGIGPDGNLWVSLGTRRELFFDIYDLNGSLLRHAVFPELSSCWNTEITEHGILAWELDPLDGYQKLYFLNL